MLNEYSNYEIPEELTTREAQLDPYPFFEEMRAENPVRYDERREVWDVFRYEDIREVVSQPSVYSSEGTSHFGKQIIASDPPEHTTFRNMLMDFFKGPGLESMKPAIEEKAERYLTETIGEEGIVDFNEEIANRYALSVFCDLVGLPESEWKQYREWTETLFVAPPAVLPEKVQASHKRREDTHEEMTEFYKGIVAEREQNPQDDIISSLLEAEKNVEIFDRELLLNTCNILMSAGHITTSTFISNAMLVLTRQNVWPKIRSGEVSVEDALDEVLRYRSPVLRFDRMAAEETELAGRTIPEGDRILLWPASGNRDPNVFENPDQYVPNRDSKKPHIAFGQGIHTCIGNQLARLETNILISKISERFSEIELDTDTHRPFYSTVLNGMDELPVRVAR